MGTRRRESADKGDVRTSRPERKTDMLSGGTSKQAERERAVQKKRSKVK